MDSEIGLAVLAAIATSFLIYRLLLAPLPFSVRDIPDLTGKTAIITGANSGLGFEAAKAMAIMACRSEERALQAIKEIKETVPDADLAFMKLELADWDSVKAFAGEFLASKKPLHILMNNAGIMAPPKFQKSKHGIELQMSGNHLGHFYLTLLLMPILEKTAVAAAKTGDSIRIVNLASIGHRITYWRGIDFSKMTDQRGYQPWLAYGQSKLSNILFSKQLQHRIDKRYPHLSNIYVNAVHPGGVSTNLGFQSANVGSLGALTQLYCATSKEIVWSGYKGCYFVPTARLATPSSWACDEKLGGELWDWSVDVLTKEGFSVPSF
ncbi:hypothetical protein BDR26DRAFT_854935 [Obelidium mucronatum]|nr:hypothetical protein BDR26DRAFT_854935 [Obelidium mucronatum]